MIVYDAENQILGRMSSVIAKQLLKGETVFVVNAEKAVLAGSPRFKKEKYMQKYKRGDTFHGPFFPKQPDRISASLVLKYSFRIHVHQNSCASLRRWNTGTILNISMIHHIVNIPGIPALAVRIR